MNPLVSESIATTESSGFWLVNVLVAGGWVMVPLVLCSIITLGIAIERLVWGPRRSRVIPEQILAQINELLRLGRLDEIKGLCRANDSSLVRLALAIIENAGQPREIILETAQAAGKREALSLQRYVGALGTISSISPLLGLLGTVSGMIKTFDVIKRLGIGQAQALSGGISEALITTATGLMIAIPAMLLHRYLLGNARELTTELQEIATGIIHRLPERASSAEPTHATPSKRQLI